MARGSLEDLEYRAVSLELRFEEAMAKAKLRNAVQEMATFVSKQTDAYENLERKCAALKAAGAHDASILPPPSTWFNEKFKNTVRPYLGLTVNGNQPLLADYFSTLLDEDMKKRIRRFFVVEGDEETVAEPS